MSRYKMEDGTIVDEDKAMNDWEEERDWDGRNTVCRATGSQTDYQHLYQSRKGRYYLVKASQWDNIPITAEWLSSQEAAKWLLLNDHELPEDLKQHAEEVCE